MLVQSLLNAICAGAGYALLGMGFGLILSTARLFHIAYGFVAAAAAYTTFSLGGTVLGALIGVVVAGLLGTAIELALYSPLRKAGAGRNRMLVLSLGILIAGQSVLSLLFGDDVLSFDAPFLRSSFDMLGARLTQIQILTLIIGFSGCLGTTIVLRTTLLGRTLTAVASDPDLAEAMGLNVRSAILGAFFVGSALGGTAMILLSMDSGLTPSVGLDVLFIGVTTVVAAGVGKAQGLLLAGLLLSLAREAGGWWLSAYWQDAIVFAVLISFLLVRPQGLFGHPIPSRTN